MDKKFCYEYPRPALTADCVVFGFDGNSLSVLLIERKHEPFKGCRAFPGGFLNPDEDVEQCVRRELREETGLENIAAEQLHVFSRPDRDPRHRTVTVAFMALVDPTEYKPCAGDDAAQAGWFPLTEIPELAFDHAEILQTAVNRLKNRIEQGFRGNLQRFTPEKFQNLRSVILHAAK